MQNLNFNTLTPALVFLIMFVASAVGHPLNEMNVTQLVTCSVSLVGVIVGIFQSHRKPDPEPAPQVPQTQVEPQKVQPPAQP